MLINPGLSIQFMAAAKKQTKKDLEEKIAELEAKLTTIAEANERKLFAYFPVIRMATSGLTGGPDLLPMLSVMGKVRVLPRLQSFLEKL